MKHNAPMRKAKRPKRMRQPEARIDDFPIGVRSAKTWRIDGIQHADDTYARTEPAEIGFKLAEHGRGQW
jgi:hypothetical protein